MFASVGHGLPPANQKLKRLRNKRSRLNSAVTRVKERPGFPSFLEELDEHKIAQRSIDIGPPPPRVIFRNFLSHDCSFTLIGGLRDSLQRQVRQVASPPVTSPL